MEGHSDKLSDIIAFNTSNWDDTNKKPNLINNVKQKWSSVLNLVKSYFKQSNGNIDLNLRKIRVNLKQKTYIGCGSFANVYKVNGECIGLNGERKVLPLVLKIQRVQKSTWFNSNVTCCICLKDGILDVLDVEEEIRNLQTVSLHPFIVTYFTCLRKGNKLLMVTEFCNDGDLSSILSYYKKSTGECGLPVEIVRLLLAPILSAIKFCNQRRIIHRDIKPNNIIVNNGIPKLCDFGTAVKLTERQNLHVAEDLPLGTYGFMAPETVNRQEQTFSVDSWSICVTGILLIFGTDGYKVMKKDWFFIRDFFKSPEWNNCSDRKVNDEIHKYFGLKQKYHKLDDNKCSEEEWRRIKKFLRLGLMKNNRSRLTADELLDQEYMKEPYFVWTRTNGFEEGFTEEYKEWKRILQNKRTRISQKETNIVKATKQIEKYPEVTL